MFDVLKAFIDDFTVMEYITFLIGIATTLVGLYLYTKNQLKTEKDEIIEKHLINNETINSYVQRLKTKTKHHPSLYKTLLENILNILSKLLGKLKIFSLQGFEKHLTYSFIYSLSFFYLAWLIGGDGRVGSHQLFPNENKIIVSLLLIFEIILFYSVIKYNNTIIYYLGKKTSFCSDTWIELLFSVIIWGLIAIIAIGGGITVATIGIGVSIVLLLGIIASIAGIGLILLLGFIELIGSSGLIIYFLFFLLLPFINAIFDYISMYFSRFFAQKILETTSKLKIFFDALLDLVIAIALLYLLAETLYFILDLTNVYLIKNKVMFIPIDYYREQILLNPFHTDIVWITLMFISTLIPTILHMFLATYALLAYFVTKPHLHDLVAKLNDLKPNDPDYLKKEEVAKGLARYRLADMIKLYLIIGTLLITLLGVVFLMLFLKKGF